MSKPPRPSLSAILPAKGTAARPEPLPDQPATATLPKAGKAPAPARKPITVKLSEAVYERLRTAAFHEKTDKQDLMDKALDEMLGRMGY